jgi:2'-phosphotransferase
MLKTLYTASRIGTRAAIKTMPRPTDSPDVAASKTLSYILRHGAEKEGLHMRSDGFIKLTDVVSPLIELNHGLTLIPVR